MAYTALIQGGGARSIWALGRLARLEDLYEEDPVAMTGISGGAFVCLLASCLGTRGAINHLLEIKSESEFYRLTRSWQYFSSKGLLRPHRLQAWLHKKLDKRSMDIPFFIATYNLKTKDLLVVSSEENTTEDMVEWVLASMTVPVVIDPVKSPYFDGWLKRSLLYEPVLTRARHMHVILTQPAKATDEDFESKKYLGLVGSVVESKTWDNIHDDMKGLRSEFDGALDIHKPDKQVIEYRDYNAEKMKLAFDDGYESLTPGSK